ncbi:omega-6 fatty acid desaturase (delta-12 desaturase) [Planomicrobium koreense]|jgi:omega-6 fatty acid desaturase (delta-12 desaturase)|uniref:Omega-6 fatty acid desaturase (Delta-12 desaturase) n=1 Tax=Planococcus koreensis TaxID=112331 RepID=A0A7W8CTT3_9BACL|nr:MULTISPECIES: fatty acid desaturase [Planococcus]MBB5181476.1 omega-6 fatty acid desaturase (delta-12 desaturase) [Planococcus koreensis]MDN3449041.1 fatty acid desaturase [Planococcus sp. APC 3906]
MSREKTAQLRKFVAPFEGSDVKASVRQIMNTIPPFIISWVLAYLTLDISIWLTVAFSAIAAGFVIRTFIIFHDCTHGSFFKNKKANAVVGTITGIMTLFAYEKWKREHSIHHASSGNLDKRGVGDIWVMTIEEYVEASKWERFKYRMYRNPLVMFGVGPLFLVLISSRFNRKDARKKERNNTYLINISLVVIYSLLIWAIGWQAFVIVQGLTMFIAGALGIWLFYVQHTFEDSYFEDESEWDYVKAAVEGSSYYKLPKVLQWVTGNIGFHHVHHLSPRVPNYNLEKAHESTPPLQQATTITIKSSLKSLRFKLYDAKNKTFVTFGDIKHLLNENKLPA